MSTNFLALRQIPTQLPTFLDNKADDIMQLFGCAYYQRNISIQNPLIRLDYRPFRNSAGKMYRIKCNLSEENSFISQKIAVGLLCIPTLGYCKLEKEILIKTRLKYISLNYLLNKSKYPLCDSFIRDQNIIPIELHCSSVML